MAKKIKVHIAGFIYELPETCLQRTGWRGEPLPTPIIRINQVVTASIIKQYVKRNYPEVCVSSTSDSYSGGCSCNVYVSDEYGFPISGEIYERIYRFGRKFQAGHFDGMTDCYNYDSSEITSDNGTKIDLSCKYVFVNNRPNFGSKPDIIRSMREHMAGNYNCGVCTFEKAKTQVARYHKVKSIETALNGVDWNKALKSK